jgi:hypothetical protein
MVRKRKQKQERWRIHTFFFVFSLFLGPCVQLEGLRSTNLLTVLRVQVTGVKFGLVLAENGPWKRHCGFWSEGEVVNTGMRYEV